MTTPSGSDGAPPWPNMGGAPSPEFLAAFQAELARRAAGATGGVPDPFAPMDAVWVTANATFQSAVRGGFTERQAVIAVVEIMMHQQ